MTAAVSFRTMRRLSGTPTRPLRSRSVFVVLAFVAGALGALCACGSDDRLQTTGAEPDSIAQLDVVIPAGTHARIEAGESVELLPASVEFHVGDVLRIVNHDDRTHVVGPFSVQAGETLTQRFSAPGAYQGECSVHPSGSVELRVLP